MKSELILRLAFVLALFSSLAFGQGATASGTPVIVNGQGQPLAGLTVAICNTNPGQNPTSLCSGGNLVSTYTDITLSTACSGTLTALNNQFAPTVGSGCSNPGLSDGQGNVVAFATAGTAAWCEYEGAPILGILVSNCNFPGGGSGGSSFYQTIQQGGTAYTQQPILNLIAGTNQTISCVNNAGQTRTDCTFSTTGGGVTSFNSRTGAVVPVLTDYQGMTQVGSGTMAIGCTTTGTCTFGNSGNFLTMYPTANSNGFKMQDTYGNFILSATSGLPGIVAKTNSGTNFTLYDDGEITFGIPGAATFVLDAIASAVTFNVPVNFAGTGGFSIAGSYGTVGQCPVSTGSGVAWNTCGASGSVNSVTGTPNQITATGSSSVTLSLPSPAIFPGNVNINQAANGNVALPMTRATDTTPSGNFLQFRSAGLTTLGFIDVFGNYSGNSYAATGSGAGLNYFTQGADNSSTCPANSACFEASASIASAFTRIWASAAASSANGSVPVWSNASPSVETFLPLSGSSSAASAATGTSALASAANGLVVTTDGNGNVKPSSTNISVVSGFAPINGPGSNYTNSTTSLTTAYSYTTSIPQNTTAYILCSGTYKFTTAAESAEFGLNFSQTPQSMAVNLYIGANATTATGTYNLITTNGAAYTAPTAAAATGTFYPVELRGTVVTNATNSSTFTIQAATSSASGTINVSAGAFTCVVF